MLRYPWVLPLAFILGLLDCATSDQLAKMFGVKKSCVKKLTYYARRLGLMRKLGRGFCATEFCHHVYTKLVLKGLKGKLMAFEYMGTPVLVHLKPTRISAFVIPRSIVEKVQDELTRSALEECKPRELAKKLGTHPKTVSRAMRYLWVLQASASRSVITGSADDVLLTESEKAD